MQRVIKLHHDSENGPSARKHAGLIESVVGITTVYVCVTFSMFSAKNYNDAFEFVKDTE